MKLKTLLIIYFLSTLPTMAQFTFPPNSTRGNALGDCYITLNDYWSNINNIAGITSISEISLGVSYQQQYILKGYAYKSISFSIPINTISTLLTEYTHYGNLTYNEQHLSAGYAMKITPKIALGLTLNYLHSGTNDIYYKPINSLTCAIGLQIYPTDNITIGTKIYNPIFIKLPTINESRIPTIINIGISYRFLNNLLGVIEFEKNIYAPLTPHIGLEYKINNFLYARMGYSSHPNTFSFGIGINQKQYAIDIATKIHPTLGFTPSISTYYSF